MWFQREIEISVKIPHLTRRQLVFFVFREAEKRNVFSCAFHAVERAQKNTEPLTSQLQIYRSLNICITFFEQPKPFFVGIKKKIEHVEPQKFEFGSSLCTSWLRFSFRYIYDAVGFGISFEYFLLKQHFKRKLQTLARKVLKLIMHR